MSCAHRSVHRILVSVLATAVVVALGACSLRGDDDEFFIKTVAVEREAENDSLRSVTVGGDHLYPPFEFLDEDGTPAGFNIELLRRVAAIMDLDVTIELTEWSEARRRLENGEVDMLAGMYRTAEREELHDFTIPLFFASYGLFVPAGSSIRGEEDLADAVIIVHQGDLAHDFVREKGLGSEIVTVSEWPDVLEALAAGRGDCAIFGMGQGMREVRRGGYRDIHMIETPLFRRGYGMAVQRGDAELLAALNEGLSVLKSTGEFDQIYEDWFGVLETGPWWNTRHARNAAILIGLGLGVATIAMAWGVVLRRQVRSKTRELRVALEDSTSAQRELVQANEAKLRFLANVSHELRTPLHGVIAMTRLLERTPLSEEQHSLVGKIDGASGQLFRVLSDLLDVSRARAGQLSMKIAPFRIREVAEWLEPTLRAAADERGLALEFSYQGPDLWISGDRERITQIVINLATNAVKFTETGVVSVRISYGSGELEIVVQDSGRGIAHEEQQKIFEPFVQAGRSEARNGGGLGLGLSIVRALVDRMDGVVSVESEHEVGTTFRVTLPLPEVTNPPIVASNDQENAEKLNRENLSILIAEDEAINRLYLTTFLTRDGATVVATADGREAVELAEQQTFDVILMDINMPTMDGLEATRQIREVEEQSGRPRRPIIALTAHATAEHARRFLDAGMTGHVSKPFNERQVWSEIERVLG